MVLQERYRLWLVKFQYTMLFLTIITLPIFALSKKFQIPYLGDRLYYYFALLGFIALGIEWAFFRFKIDKITKIFFVVFLGWQMLSLLFGLYQYPYYQEINWHSSPGLSRFINFTINHGLDFITINQMEAIWLAMRVIKNTLIDLLFTFGISVWIIHLFFESFDRGFSIVRKYIFALAIALGIYAIPEILFFKFKMKIGYDILSITNPLMYDVGKYLDWYPPLIWMNEQVRSYCVEPSTFGVLAATIIPILWSYCLENIKYSSVYLYYIMLVFMTKSRTSNAIVIFDTLFLLFGVFFHKTRKWAVVLIIFTSLGFICNIGMNFIPTLFSLGESINTEEKSAYSYYENNVKSIVEPDSRSNGSRMINIIGHINVARQHLLIGVGRGLETCYIRDNLPDGALSNKEISSITEKINKNGPLTLESYGNVNHYAYVLTNIGLIGLFIYLLPFIYVLWMVFKLRLWMNNRYIFLSIALLGDLLAGMAGEVIMLSYILLGLLYIGVRENYPSFTRNEIHSSHINNSYE